MSETRRLDEVTIFNDKLSFLIPHEWVEVESGEDGDYLYQMPNARSGWFRVSLITAESENPEERMAKLLSNRNVEVNEATGNRVARSEKETTENGDLLHIYYWFVAAQVSPKLIREAIFSYTVLTEFLSDDLTQSEVKLIDQLVGRARFAAPMTAAGE